MRTLLTAATLLTPADRIDQPMVLLDDGHIVEILSRTAAEQPEHVRRLDYPGATLVPSFLDVHIHGSMGHDVMEGSAAALDAVGRFVARHGVAAYLPTTVTAPVDSTLRAMELLADRIERAETECIPGCARPLGIHLEGPFLSHAKRGVHPPQFLQPPSLDLLRKLWEAARGRIVLMTVAPELPGATEMIEHAIALGIRVSLGHSNADSSQARAGIAAGATSATHAYNAMRPLDHREPGLLGIVLDDSSLFSELICDGIHVDPVMVRLFLKAKGPDRGILMTDGISATGMPDGVYQLGELPVTVADGKCLYEGKLAGSVLTFDRAIRNFLQFTQTTPTTAARYASTNPARMIGFAANYGELAPGRQADITVLSPQAEVVATLLAGQPVDS